MARNLYRITGRAPASVIFRGGESMLVNYVRDGITGRVVFSTRYMPAGLSAPLPGDFAVVIEAEADTVGEAVTWVTVGRELASIISLAANAAIAPLKAELVYDITPGKKEREFFQRLEPADQGTLSSRIVPMDAARALLSAVGANAERDRLLRAIMQYNEALLRWELGTELLVIAHLWMGIEAITKSLLRLYLEEAGVTKEDLATEWGFDPKRYMTLDHFVDAEARVRLTCLGDRLHHGIAKGVSDRFEHGLANGGQLFAGASDTLIPIASYLRRAVFKVAQVDDAHRQVMLSEPYDRPRGPGGLEQYLSATLVGESEKLAADGFDHPICEWERKIKEATLDQETWRYEFTPEHNFTPQIGNEIKFVGPRLEIWDGGIFMPKSAADKAAEAELSMKPIARRPEAG